MLSLMQLEYGAWLNKEAVHTRYENNVVFLAHSFLKHYFVKTKPALQKSQETLINWIYHQNLSRSS